MREQSRIRSEDTILTLIFCIVFKALQSEIEVGLLDGERDDKPVDYHVEA